MPQGETSNFDRQWRVYRSAAADYDRLVSAEDAGGHLRVALGRLLASEARLILDVGTGTGRVTRLVGSPGRRVVGVDRSLHMLSAFRPSDPDRAHPAAAEVSELPFPSRQFDAVLAGWVIGHCTVWHHDWRRVASQQLVELTRVVRTGGRLIILETLGTCVDSPGAPTDRLRDYYRWLETEGGFRRQLVRTDYVFPSLAEATRLTETFFGGDVSEKVKELASPRVEEYTGIWSKRVPKRERAVAGQRRLLILVRHSAVKVEPGVDSSQWELSAKGRRKALRLARPLAPFDPVAVIGSREPKAAETAFLVAQRLGCATYAIKGLEENDRKDLPFFDTELAYEEAVGAFFREPDALVIGAETASQARRRFALAIDELLSRHRTGNLVVVAHGAVITLFVQLHNPQVDLLELWKALRMPDFRILELPQMRLLIQEEAVARAHEAGRRGARLESPGAERDLPHLPLRGTWYL